MTTSKERLANAVHGAKVPATSAEVAKERLLTVKASELPETYAGDEPPKDSMEEAKKLWLDPNIAGKIALPLEPPVALSVAETLAQRGSRYGDFTDHARICQDLKEVMVDSYVDMPELTTATEVHREHKWHKLSPVQKQALEVIADKIARILSGDPNYDDNWHDIQGYAKLVEDRLPKKES